MRKRSSARHSNAFGLALFIGSLIGLLIIVAIGIKVFLVFSQSKFDGKHQYVLEMVEPSQERFVVFNPDNSSVRMLLVKGKLTSNPQNNLGIPVDGVLYTSDDINAISDITSYLLFHNDKTHDSLTIVDAINLFVFTHTSDTTKPTTQTITLSENSVEQDSAMTKALVDTTLYNEGKSIAVINGTAVSGLGSEVSRFLTHIGGNVISTTTAVLPSQTSSVGYTGQLTYTAKRIAHLLQFPLVHLSGSSISDITVTIGADKVSALTN